MMESAHDVSRIRGTYSGGGVKSGYTSHTKSALFVSRITLVFVDFDAQVIADLTGAGGSDLRGPCVRASAPFGALAPSVAYSAAGRGP